MVKVIVKSSFGERYRNFMAYNLTIDDGSTIIAWARPYIHVTSVVRTSNNFREIDDISEIDNNEDVYLHRNRYYRFTPGFLEF